jgi:acyl-homoserine-lactone acylase
VEVAFCAGHSRGDLSRAGIRLAGLDLPDPDNSLQYGSNQFAVAPQRSGTNAAQLSMDPHLPHYGFYRWYEMHLVGPDLNLMGACFFGTPYPSMGRTARSAWCMTVNGPDLGDVFVFDIHP